MIWWLSLVIVLAALVVIVFLGNPDERCRRSKSCPVREGRAPLDCTEEEYEVCDHRMHLEG